MNHRQCIDHMRAAQTIEHWNELREEVKERHNDKVISKFDTLAYIDGSGLIREMIPATKLTKIQY